MRKNILILGHNDATQFIDIYNQYTSLFDKDRYQVTVAYLTGEPNEESRQRTLAENVIFFNISKKSIRSLKIKAIKKILAFCKEKSFHMVICHRYKPTYIMMWVAQFYHIPAVIFVMHELNTMAALTRQLLVAGLLRKNMLFAGVSNAVRDDLRRSLWRVAKNNITTLYNTIDVDHTALQLFSREESRKKLNLPDHGFIFANIARLAPNKNHEHLIRAFKRIKCSCKDAKLIIIGDGDLANRLKDQVAACGLTGEIIFKGFVSQAFRYMQAFDCFVLPSIQEAFGRVLLEAMIAKLPIIAARVHGIPEVLGQTEILVDPKNIDDLASAMQGMYALSPQARKTYGEAAYQQVSQHFSYSTFYQQFWHLPQIQAALLAQD